MYSIIEKNIKSSDFLLLNGQEYYHLPKQMGQVGSSVEPTGGVVSISKDWVNSAETKKNTWHTSPYKYLNLCLETDWISS